MSSDKPVYDRTLRNGDKVRVIGQTWQFGKWKLLLGSPRHGDAEVVIARNLDGRMGDDGWKSDFDLLPLPDLFRLLKFEVRI